MGAKVKTPAPPPSRSPRGRHLCLCTRNRRKHDARELPGVCEGREEREVGEELTWAVARDGQTFEGVRRPRDGSHHVQLKIGFVIT